MKPNKRHIQVKIPESTCNWFFVSSLVRSLSDQPTRENVIVALQAAEEFLTREQRVPIPGLLHAIMKNLHLHYLRELDHSLIHRLAFVACNINDWIIQSNITDRYPALPELVLNVVFATGSSQLIYRTVMCLLYSGQQIPLEWIAHGLAYGYPNPAQCIIELCRSPFSESEQGTAVLLQLLQAYEQVEYLLTNADYKYALQIHTEWDRKKIHPDDLRAWFSHVFGIGSGSPQTPHSNQAGRGFGHISNGVGAVNSSVSYYPALFRWTHGGKVIKLAGSFNDWTEYIPLNDVGDGVFEVILDLPEGVHQYKFIVDGEWRCDVDAPLLVESLSGYKNNYLSVPN
jgi:hypothetical protein